jgi:hypothetical protein
MRTQRRYIDVLVRAEYSVDCVETMSRYRTLGRAHIQFFVAVEVSAGIYSIGSRLT